MLMLKLVMRVIIYDTSGSFSATIQETWILVNNRRGTDNAVYENARNATNDFITFGNGTAGAPNAANGGAWVIGEPFDYRGFSTGNTYSIDLGIILVKIKIQASKYNLILLVTPICQAYQLHSIMYIQSCQWNCNSIVYKPSIE